MESSKILLNVFDKHSITMKLIQYLYRLFNKRCLFTKSFGVGFARVDKSPTLTI
jgi:hypothetical protein